jgi:hypothetical protein
VLKKRSGGKMCRTTRNFLLLNDFFCLSWSYLVKKYTKKKIPVLDEMMTSAFLEYSKLMLHNVKIRLAQGRGE